MSLHDRVLTEAVSVGDYVVARDGRCGYASRVEDGQVYFKYDHYDHSENVVMDVADVNVTVVEMRGQYMDDMQRFANRASVAFNEIKALLPKIRASIQSGDTKKALAGLDSLAKKL